MELIAENVTCRRGGRTVLRDLSFSVGAGQALILRGPNGSGKSTLLRLLAGLLPLTDGSVRIGGAALEQDRSAVQELAAYAGHLDAVKPALSVRQNLGLWASVYGGKSADIEAGLAHFGLDRIHARPTAQCSAGQKRRLGLARLMVVNRPLWLLDEPTVSLDTDASAKVAELVRDHCAKGGIALIATHIDLGLSDAEVLTLQAESTSGAAIQPGDDDFLAGDWT